MKKTSDNKDRVNNPVLEYLYANEDKEYALFQAKLTPGIAIERFIGVRTPIVKAYAKKLYKTGEYKEFIHNLPHKYFDEDRLHGCILSEIRDFDECIEELDRFIPYMDNWATVDQIKPYPFKKNRDKALPHIYRWLAAKEPYTIRFAIGMLMTYYLDDAFDAKYLADVTSIRSEEYYVNMEIAWYMATALAKQWDAAWPHITNRSMDVWTHNQTIKKAIESFRVSDEHKEMLKKEKIKNSSLG